MCVEDQLQKWSSANWMWPFVWNKLRTVQSGWALTKYKRHCYSSKHVWMKTSQTPKYCPPHSQYHVTLKVCEEKFPTLWYFDLLPPLIYHHKLQWTDSGTTLGFDCITFSFAFVWFHQLQLMEIIKNNFFIWIRWQICYTGDVEAKPFTPHNNQSHVF
jgi:hypothetical protein